MISKLREFLKGKKTYLVAVAGVITALIAFANGQISALQLLYTILGACGLSSIKAAISKIAL